MMRFVNKISLALLIIAFASDLAGFFFLQLQTVEGDVFLLTALVLSKAAFMLLPGFISYFKRVSLTSVYIALIFLFLLFQSLNTYEAAFEIPQVVISFISGGMSGLMLLIIVSSFTLFSSNESRVGIIAAFALSAIFLLACHWLAELPDAQIRSICLWTCLLTITLFYFLRVDGLKSLPSVKETSKKFRVNNKMAFSLFLSPKASMLVGFSVLMIFTFCYGVFEVYSFSLGHQFLSSSATLTSILIASIFLLVFSAIPVLKKWMDEVFFILCVGSLYSMRW